MPDQITAAAIVAQHEAYYRDNGQGIKDLKNELKQDTVSEMYISDKGTARSQVVDTAFVTSTEVMQAYQDTWTSKGGAVITPNQMILKKVKVDKTLKNLQALFESWLGFLDNGNLDYRTKPLTTWFINTVIIPQIKEDLELKMVFKGVRVEPTAGTAGPAINAIDGFGTQIAKGIIAGSISPTVMGAIPTGIDADITFVKLINDFFQSAVPRLYRDKLGPILVSQDLYDMYTSGMDIISNSAYKRFDDDKLNEIRINGGWTGVKLVGVPSQNGSSRIWTTTKGNSAKRVMFGANENTFEVQVNKREVDIFTEWYLAYNFWYHQMVYCTELA